jgi:hypothetical protein
MAEMDGVSAYHNCKKLLDQAVNTTIQYKKYRMSVERAVEILQSALQEMSWFQKKSLRVRSRRDMVSLMLALHGRALKELWACGGHPHSGIFFQFLESKLRELLEWDCRL